MNLPYIFKLSARNISIQLAHYLNLAFVFFADIFFCSLTLSVCESYPSFFQSFYNPDNIVSAAFIKNSRHIFNIVFYFFAFFLILICILSIFFQTSANIILREREICAYLSYGFKSSGILFGFLTENISAFIFSLPAVFAAYFIFSNFCEASVSARIFKYIIFFLIFCFISLILSIYFNILKRN